jgi:hypothetical protein
MPGSYLSVNYQLRPAKGVERRMFAETLRRLTPFANLESYRYVGFGSPFFADFSLFHRALGIATMINIEVEESDRPRFRFNRPFGCVQLRFGRSTAVLDRLRGWRTPTILWLDYDGRLDRGSLEDVRIFFTNAGSGSVILVTVNAEPLRGKDERETDANRLAEAAKLEGRAVPALSIRPEDLGGSGTARYFRKHIDSRIQQTLNARNSGLDETDPSRMEYRQLFYFEYADSTRMLSVGGILYRRGDRARLRECKLTRKAVPFIRTADEPCDIQVPPLTAHEVRHLNAQLPLKQKRVLAAPGVSDTALARFREIYRYYPAYFVAET